MNGTTNGKDILFIDFWNEYDKYSKYIRKNLHYHAIGIYYTEICDIEDVNDSMDNEIKI